ncbi:hypothetical protein Tco_1062225 [Tanacetum coccineum]
MRRHRSLQSRHLPLPDYVPGPEYPKYLVPSDDEVPIEDQPLPVYASPTFLSLGYVVDSDPEEDPKEDPEEDPTDYPTDRGDDDDDNDNDDGDEEEEFSKEGEEEEEEELLALADLTPPRSPQNKRQRISDGDRLTSYIQHEHDQFRELARTRDAGHQDRPADVGSSC